ncbi:hypothetical protein ACP4OV_028845 [Aristida adscensionis]
MAGVCCKDVKLTPSPPPAAAHGRRRPRAEMAVAAGVRPEPAAAAAEAGAGAVRGGKRRRVAPGRPCPRLGSSWWPRFGVTSFCGLRREMEDAVSIRPDFLPPGASPSGGRHHFFGVFDGHGCSHVARMCQDRMHELVADERKKAGSAGEGATAPGATPAWKEVMERGFARMDDEVTSWAASRGGGGGGGGEPACRCELQTPARCDHVGSTAVVAVVSSTHVVVSNAGDSRAVLSRTGVPVPLSVDHKPDRPDELERIKAAGGRVIHWDGARVLGVLAMSRAIGDGYLKPFVTPEPEVTVAERTDDDECLILASDGLWDVVTSEMACDVVRACFRGSGPPSPPGARPNGVLPSPGQRGAAAAVKGVDKAESDRACSDAALLLAKLALARRSSDNVSVVVVDLRRGS